MHRYLSLQTYMEALGRTDFETVNEVFATNGMGAVAIPVRSCGPSRKRPISRPVRTTTSRTYVGQLTLVWIDARAPETLFFGALCRVVPVRPL
jgi:hypothetical protein